VGKAQSDPRLVESTGDWNIIWFRDAAYAVPKSLGPADLINDTDRERVLAAGAATFSSVAEAKAHALREDTAALLQSPPQLVETTDDWNIVWFRKQAYAMPKSLGTTDLTDDADRTRALAAGVVLFSSVAEAKLHIQREEAATGEANANPEFIDTVGTWNILWFKDVAYVVPQFLGAIDLKSEDARSLALKSGGMCFKTIPEARSYAMRSL
jgi:hypothetical protein